MQVEIDNRSGFCFGVVKAIGRAEEELKAEGSLFCLGEIVHNDEEVRRLSESGLKTISHTQMDKVAGQTLLLRAHGEPPETYRKAKELGIKLIDASCPVVLKLQAKVKEGWERMQKTNGQVVIYGKKDHAEVVGLMGQIEGYSILISSIEEIERIDFSRPIELFSQTTQSHDKYIQIAHEIVKRMEKAKPGSSVTFTLHKSICGQVGNRKRELAEFAPKFNVVVFVSGKNSSNGKMLYQVCKNINPNTYFVSSASEVEANWFEPHFNVGICGATSTPLWLMEQVAERIRNIGVEMEKE